MAKKTYRSAKYKRAGTGEELSQSWRSMNAESFSGMGRAKFGNPDFKRRMQL